jgi:hypothetical protein
VQVRIFHCDRKTEPGATDCPRTRRIPSPEAMEDLPGLTGFEPDPMIANCDCHRGVVTFDQDVDGMALTVLDRVDKEVPQYPLDAPRIDLGLGLTAFMHGNLGVVRFGQSQVGIDHAPDQITQIDLLDVELGRAGIEARDLQQVAEQRLEAIQLVLQEFRGARRDRIEFITRLLQHLRCHPDGRQRRTQLVGDIGDESLLDGRQLLESVDLFLQL